MLNLDFSDILAAFSAQGTKFLMVGGYAVMHYTEPRFTKDLDLWVRPDPQNAERVFRALAEFGAPLAGVTPADFAQPGVVFQIGVPPNRIDILTSVDGVTFDEAWATREEIRYGDEVAALPSAEMLILNKRASGRPHDLIDAAALEAWLIRHRSGGGEPIR